MKPLWELLRYLQSKGINLEAKGSQLHWQAPKGVMTPEMRLNIAANKQQLITYLTEVGCPPLSNRLIRRAYHEQPLPLSFAQGRLWFLNQLENSPSAAYNVPGAIKLGGILDRAILKKTLNEVVHRHEVLRTVFCEGEAGPVQVILPELAVALPVVEASGVARAELDRQLAAMAAEAFDLSKGPLLRAQLYRLGETEHVLFLCAHHIVFDGWSMGVLFRELSTLYGELCAGRAASLAELTIQYADYAAWQREWLSGETLQRQLDYWTRQLAGAPALLELPTDRPRPRVQSFRGGRVSFCVPRPLVAGLGELGRRAGATPFMVLLAAYAVLLSRWSGQQDVVIGTPIAGRRHPALETLIGFFVNTLGLRIDLQGDPSFMALLGQVKATALDAYAYQDLPFEQLVEALQPERSLSRTPLFQAMLAVQNAPAVGLELGGLKATAVDLAYEIAKFDLTLGLAEVDGALLGGFEYNADLFDAATIARMAGHFQTLLGGIVADPERPVSALPLLSAAERCQLLEEWNATARAYPVGRCIHELFEAQARQRPTAVAVEFEGERLSYGALERRANQLAHHLRGLGVGPETLVGLCVERSVEMVVGLLGILKAGGAYLPLDPEYPEQRLAFMLQDAQVPLVVAHAPTRERLGESPARLVCLDADRAQLDDEPETAPASGAGPDNAAYVIYTSGSTGQPKGVVVPHSALRNHMEWMLVQFSFSPSTRVLQKTPIGFDASVWEFWVPLLTGGQLVLAPPEIHRSPTELVRILEEAKITVVQFVPTLLRALLEQPGFAACGLLVDVFCGGEALLPELASRFFVKSNANLHNLYGPTETAIDATWWTCRRDIDQLSIPIGRPIANARAYVLDDCGGLVPVGVAGELHIGGAGVARGYLNRPALTAERFVSDPFSEEPGARLYRTGDLCRWRADGTLEFLGRRDEQVKIRGFRIEPGEIEAVLGRHPAVRDGAVVARDGAGGERRLVAYVVPAASEGAELRDLLRAHLRRSLPEHMVPGQIVFLPALPLSANGKLDRHALPEPEALPSAATYVAPRDPTEEILAGIWAEVLGVERVGIHDNFFDLGGHSLLATQVVSRVREAFDRRIEVPVRALFEAPTLADLAAHLATAGSMPSPPPIRLISRERPPLPSFAQQRLWFLGQLQASAAAYHVPGAFALQGPMQIDALEQALQAIVDRHEVLRTVFCEGEAGPVQVILPELAVALPVVEASGVARAELDRQLAAMAAEAFDLSKGPLLRAQLYRLGETEHVLFLCAHHIVFDGWSMGVLFRELSTLYGELCAGRAASLAELTIQYADYAAWQREWLSGETLQRQLDYWTRQLAGAPALLELPTDRPRPPVQSFRGGRVSFCVPRPLVAGLGELGRRAGATPFMVLLAAYAVLLSRWSGQQDVVIGTPIAGRRHPALETLIGFFVNTLGLRIDLQGDPSFMALLGQVKATALDAYAYQDLPFEQLVEALQPERSLSRTPLFQAMLAVQNAPAVGLELGGLKATAVDLAYEIAKFDLTLGLAEVDGALLGGFEYNADLFDAATIARMAGHFQTLLGGIVADPERPVSALPLLSAAERCQLLEEWNATARAYPVGRCIHELFEAQARQRPTAVAVEFEGERLSYGALERRANQLAHHLRGLGVGPETLVGLCVERSVEMVVGLLGILKAGGAYLPLDPEYPEQRLAFMLQDAQVPLVVAHAPTRERLGESPARLVCLDADRAQLDDEPETAPASGAGPDNAAYVIYTSGSTGQPKGVVVEHRNVVRLVCGTDYVELGPDTVLLQLAPLAFDASTFEIWGALLQGGRLVVAPPGRLPLEDLAALLLRSGVNTLWLTAGLFHLVVDRQPEGLRGLRQLLAGGDVLSPEHVRRVLEELPGLQVINGYGPTEATTFSCCYHVPAAGWEGTTLPIGRPIANARAYVLDDCGGLVPVGVAGELHIGGAGVARGYLNRPALTAERFVSDPFSEEPGARLYRTGDLCRWRADGTLEFLGRRDEQVKIRGFRIEPGEIEAVLGRHPAVRDGAVVARDGAGGERRLVAYVVPAASEGAELRDLLRAHLRRSLPEHMVPGQIVFLPALPLSANGKLDRHALPEPEALPSAATYVAPRDPTEEILAGIWAEVLGVERVGIHDNFFDLGGHSLLAMRLIRIIRKTFGMTLQLITLLEAPNVSHLAERLRRMQIPRRFSIVSAIQSQGECPPLFCVHPAGGTSLCYAGFRKYLGQNQPLYGVQAVGSDGMEAPLTSVEEMAERYAAEIRRIQPRGPYRICGWSLGGVVAYEMGRQLYQQDRSVSPLFLIDSYAPPLPVQEPLGLLPFIHALTANGLVSVPEYVLNELDLTPPAQQLARFISTTLDLQNCPTGSDPNEVLGLWRVYIANMQAGQRYRPSRWPSVIRLLQATSSAAPSAPPGLGWAPLAATVETRVITGSHESLLSEPILRLVATHLQEWLNSDLSIARPTRKALKTTDPQRQMFPKRVNPTCA